jgi:hypothetical protein
MKKFVEIRYTTRYVGYFLITGTLNFVNFKIYFLIGADINGLAICQKEAEAMEKSISSESLKSGGSTCEAPDVSVSALRELLKVHTAYFHTKDMRMGGTPLHWTTEKPTMEALIGRMQLLVNLFSTLWLLIFSIIDFYVHVVEQFLGQRYFLKL